MVHFNILRWSPLKTRQQNLVIFTYKIGNDIMDHIEQFEKKAIVVFF